MNDNNNHQTFAKKQSKSILVSAFYVYSLMALVGALIMFYLHQNLISSFNPFLVEDFSWKIPTSTVLLIGLAFVISYVFDSLSSSYRRMKHIMILTLGPCSIFTMFLLALLSGLGEEILFRGAVQPWLGLAATSILFGLVHLSPDGKLSMWSVATGLVGLLFGWVYQETGCLIPAVLAHILINFISLCQIHLIYKRDYSKTIISTTANSDL